MSIRSSRGREHDLDDNDDDDHDDTGSGGGDDLMRSSAPPSTTPKAGFRRSAMMDTIRRQGAF